jgi:hypothetical protein
MACSVFIEDAITRRDPLCVRGISCTHMLSEIVTLGAMGCGTSLLAQLELLGHLPRTLNIVGYGRSKVVLSDFLEKQCINVKEQPGLTKKEFKVRRGRVMCVCCLGDPCVFSSFVAQSTSGAAAVGL